jgi:hypothetical protein
VIAEPHAVRGAALLALLIAACGSSPARVVVDAGDPDAAEAPPPPPCTRVLPDCPMPPPSFATSVGAIFAQRCANCHSPTGIEPTKLLTTYAEIYKLRTTVLTQVFACKMPPPDAGSFPEEVATELISWLVCGAPNN